jgi:hypothetical protein
MLVLPLESSDLPAESWTNDWVWEIGNPISEFRNWLAVSCSVFVCQLMTVVVNRVEMVVQ